MTYADKLKHPKWQKKRLLVLERDGFTCKYCADTESTLHVHHIKYTGDNPWDAPDEDLITICEDCHEINHLKLSQLEAYLIDIVRKLAAEYPYTVFTQTTFIKTLNLDIKDQI